MVAAWLPWRQPNESRATCSFAVVAFAGLDSGAGFVVVALAGAFLEEGA
jgi:hypothetical protein